MKVKSITVAATLLLSLSACKSVVAPYAKPAIKLPETYATDLEISTQNPAIASHWWLRYQNPELNALMDKALAHNTDVMAAIARIEDAEAALIVAGSTRLPSVSVGGDASRERVSERAAFPAFGSNPRNNYQLALNSSTELNLWQRLDENVNRGRANLLATQFAKSTVMWSLSSLVAGQYFTLSSLDTQLAVNHENQVIATKSIDLAKARLAGGIASRLDVLQAQSQLDELQSQAINLKRLRALSLHQLQLLTGNLSLTLPPQDILAFADTPAPVAGMPSVLLANRPDIQEAEQLLQASHANMALAKAALYPSISLTGQLGAQSLELSDLLRPNSRIWTLGVSFNLPIFTNGKLKAEVRQATAQQQEQLANYIAAVRTAFTEVSDALENVSAYRDSLALAEVQRSRATDMLTIAENRYKEGYSDYLAVLEAQRNHHDVTLSFVQSRQNVMLATIDLFKALGGTWE